MRIRVGSSSPATFGSAGAVDVRIVGERDRRPSRAPAAATGSARRCRWSMTGASVTSNSMIAVPPDGASVRLRTSSTPVPLAPPVAFVLLALAPAGTVTTVSVPGWKAGSAFRRSISSRTVSAAQREVGQVLEPQAVAQPVARARLGGGIRAAGHVGDGLLEHQRRRHDHDARRILVASDVRIRRAVDVGIVRDRTRRVVGEPQRRLVGHDRADRQASRPA